VAHSFSREERLLGESIMQTRVLKALCAHVLGELPEPVEEAHAFADVLRRELEEAASGLGDREAAFVQQTIIEPMDAFWNAVIEQLEESDRPIPYAPTEYGYRRWDQRRGDKPPRTPGDEPDQ
jgi:hypothetical protein